MNEAQKELDFDQYTGPSQSSNEKAVLTPNTAALKIALAQTPAKESWEEAADKVSHESNNESPTVNQTEQSASSTNAPVALLEKKDDGSETAQPEKCASEDDKVEENLSDVSQSEKEESSVDDSHGKRGPHKQENPPSTTNTSHKYSLGLGGDESSTQSDKILGLDKISLQKNTSTGATKRVSLRQKAKTAQSNSETEKDAT